VVDYYEAKLVDPRQRKNPNSNNANNAREYNSVREYNGVREYNDTREYNGVREYNNAKEYNDIREYNNAREYNDIREYNNAREYNDENESVYEYDEPTITINGKTTRATSPQNQRAEARRINSKLNHTSKQKINTSAKQKHSAQLKLNQSAQPKNAQAKSAQKKLNHEKGLEKQKKLNHDKGLEKQKKSNRDKSLEKHKKLNYDKNFEKKNKIKIAKATMATNFDVPAIEEVKWEPEKVNAKKKTAISKPLIVMLIIAFVGAMGIVYQYSLVNSSFMEKSKLENELSEIEKQNEQLKVKMESATNIKTIEQEAKERLGMQKLDSNQKVYVNLDKEDHVAASSETAESGSWIEKLFNDLFNK